jgi:hypothetical protein
MNRWQLITFGSLAFVLGGGTLWARNVVRNLDHVLLTSTLSPDRKYDARLYVFGESETPPYGVGVAIGPASRMIGFYSGQNFVFKGRREKASLSWPLPER